VSLKDGGPELLGALRGAACLAHEAAGGSGSAGKRPILAMRAGARHHQSSWGEKAGRRHAQRPRQPGPVPIKTGP